MTAMLRKQLLDSARGRIVTLLQHGGLTVDEIASRLELTPNGVRAHITAMERDGAVRRGGQRRGTTRPSSVFELTAEIQQMLSGAYVPLLIHLVGLFESEWSEADVNRFMRKAGRSLAAELRPAGRPADNLRARVKAASDLLNHQLGAVTHVEENGHLVIRGASCPLAALTGTHRSVCLAMESFVGELIGNAVVHECCERGERPRCCFEVRARATR
jgi:DeoR family transcriptional regulator, suf operon transcriptional repressor